jgi:hypothetical protein
LKAEALDRIKWRNRFGRGCGPVVWQITDECMKNGMLQICKSLKYGFHLKALSIKLTSCLTLHILLLRKNET